MSAIIASLVNLIFKVLFFLNENNFYQSIAKDIPARCAVSAAIKCKG